MPYSQRIQKVADSSSVFTGYLWTGGKSQRKSCGFKNIRIRVDNALTKKLKFQGNLGFKESRNPVLIKDTSYQRNMSSQVRKLLVVFSCSILLPAYSTANYDGKLLKSTSASPCSCSLRGRVYNLAPLASSDGSPRFETDVKGWNYAFNPCILFTVKIPECENIAICRWKDNGQPTYQALGKQTEVHCQLEQDVEELVFQVPNNPSMETRVRMKCNPRLRGLHDARFSVIDGDYENTILEVEHNCCCPDACPLGKPLPTHTSIYKVITIVIGSVLGLVLIGLVAFGCFWWCRRRRNRGQGDQEPLQEQRNNGPREN